MRILDELPIEAGGERIHTVGATDLCEFWGISSGMLTNLVKREIAVRVGRDSYDLVRSTQRYVDHLRGVASGRGDDDQVTNLTAERARLAKEQADAQAIKNAKLREELVEAKQVERQWSDTLRQVRARILAAPARLRSDLPEVAPEVIDAMDRTLRAALTELGNGD